MDPVLLRSSMKAVPGDKLEEISAAAGLNALRRCQARYKYKRSGKLE